MTERSRALQQYRKVRLDFAYRKQNSSHHHQVSQPRNHALATKLPVEKNRGCHCAEFFYWHRHSSVPVSSYGGGKRRLACKSYLPLLADHQTTPLLLSTAAEREHCLGRQNCFQPDFPRHRRKKPVRRPVLLLQRILQNVVLRVEPWRCREILVILERDPLLSRRRRKFRPL